MRLRRRACNGLVSLVQRNQSVARSLTQYSFIFDYGAYDIHREITFDGFSDNLFICFKEFVDLFRKFEITEKAFSVSKEKLCKAYRNSLLNADDLRSELKFSVLHKTYTSDIRRLKELKYLTLEKLQEYGQDYFSQLYVECLFQGNITEEEAKSYLEYLQSSLGYKPLPKEDVPRMLTLKLPVGRSVCRHYGFNRKDPNTSVQNYYQFGPLTLQQYTVALILSHIMDEPLFDILRTQQQLGYSLSNQVHTLEGIYGFSINVETEIGKHTADHVDAKIEEFLLTFEEKLKGFTKEEYQKYITSYIKTLKLSDIVLYDEASRNWEEICDEEYLFDRTARMIKFAEEIKCEEVIEFMQTYLLNKDTVRALCTQVVGHSDDEHADESKNDDEEDSSSSSESDADESSDESSDEEDSKLDDRDLNFCLVVGTQYTRCITDLEAFHEENTFYPYTKMTV